MIPRTKSDLAARTPERAKVLAEIQKAGARGASCLEVAQALAIPFRHAVQRAAELLADGLIVRGPRVKVGEHDASHYVTPELLDMHVAWWAAWKAEAAKERIAALPKKPAKPKPVKKPKPVALKTTLESAWRKGTFAHLRSQAGDRPAPFTKGVRSIFEVATA